jgi:hypothetical protein
MIDCKNISISICQRCQAVSYVTSTILDIVFYLEHGVSETGLCLRLRMEPIELGLIDRASLCYWTLNRSRSCFPTDSQSVCLGIEHPFGTCHQILLLFGMLLSAICRILSVGLLLWREDGSAICSAIIQWSESPRTRNHTLLFHLSLPQPGGLGSRIYIPQEQGGPVIPRHYILYVASCDSQGYGAGILTLSQPGGTDSGMVQSKVKAKSQSHFRADGQLISMFWCLVYADLQGLHPNEFQSDIRRGTLRWNFSYYRWEGCMRSMQCIPIQHLLWDQGKQRKSLIELVGRRTFQMQTDF